MAATRKTLKELLHNARGLTLVEMLVTLLILTLASTLLAMGVPVATDTYHKTVNCSNAQIALSTTLTVLRTEIGTSADVRIVEETIPGGAKENKIYYLAEEGYWASISNPPANGERGLVKQYYAGKPAIGSSKNSVDGLGDPIEGMSYPLVSDSAISKPLHVSFDVDVRTLQNGSIPDYITLTNVRVDDEAVPPNALASVEDYRILLRFEENNS